MTEIDVLDAKRGAAGYKVDVTRSERIGRVSSEWACGRFTHRQTLDCVREAGQARLSSFSRQLET